jgi:phosphatidylglycerophosphate synthase
VWPVLALLSVVLLTDLADGALARRRGQVTRIGSYLDSSTDYLLLGTAAILSLIYRIGTPWVFAVLIGRLTIQSAAVLWIVSAGRPLPSATRLGKASIAAGMVLLAVELAAALGGRVVPSSGILALLRTVVELAFAGVLVASAVEKLVLLTRTARQSRSGMS